MTTYRSTLAHISRPSGLAAMLRLPAQLIARAAFVRSRRGLARLDDHLLRDIGISRSQALDGASRAGWDAPSHWKG